MKTIKKFIFEKLKINKDTVIGKHTRNYDFGIISDYFKYDGLYSMDTNALRYIYPCLDKKYIKDNPCSPEELKFDVKANDSPKDIDTQEKLNKIAKIIGTWPLSIINKKRITNKGIEIKDAKLPGIESNHNLDVDIYKDDDHHNNYVFRLVEKNNYFISLQFKMKKEF